MKSLCLTHKSIRKQSKFTEHEYHKHRPRKALFSELVYVVQIYPVFTGPVTNYVGTSLIGNFSLILSIAMYIVIYV